MAVEYVGGTAYFKIDGRQYRIRANFKISLGDQERETVVGIDEVHGLIQKPAVPYIEADFTDQADLDLNVLEKAKDVTVTAELINGKTAVLNNASQVKKIELNVADGIYSARFEGKTGDWDGVQSQA